MTAKEIIKKLENLNETKVRIAVADIDGILRGKVISMEKFKNIVSSGFGFCNVIFGWDSADDDYENGTYAGWHTGYPDIDAYVDVNTFRNIPWNDDIPFFLADFSGQNESKDSSPVCPRTLLKKVKAQLENEFGFTAKFSQEFEWFNFDETPQSLHEKGYKDPRPMTPGMFGYSVLRSSLRADYFNDIFDFLLEFEIPLEGIHTETGPGVYEAAITYSDILEAGDRAVLFKTAVKEIAYQHEVMASFMAKWNDEYPGCGGHIHQSLWKGNKNLFFEEKDANGMSEIFKNYVAGQLYCLPHILPMYAPTINSFKRLVEGAWAPTTITWGLDNRTVAARVIAGSKKSTRLETRVPGSDTNPYLAMAACLASGMYGIRKNLKLDQPPTQGNGYKDDQYGRLPSSLSAATEKMKNSELAKEILGNSFVNHFVETREWECKQAEKAGENWEMKRYFEII